MEQIPLKKQAVLSIFGTKLGTKLLNSLNDCCQPNINLTFTATCAGIDPITGDQTYDVKASATYNTNIAGYTTLIGYVSNQPFPDWTNVTSDTLNNLNITDGTIFVSNIEAGVPCVVANLTGVNLTAGDFYFMITDNRGNFAAPLTVSIPNCA